MSGTKVVVTKRCERNLRKVPSYIADKLDDWIEAVETDGIAEVRKLPGFHDEPLHGDRRGQRSIRLSKSYRAIYEIKSEREVQFLSVEEVTKHVY